MSQGRVAKQAVGRQRCTRRGIPAAVSCTFPCGRRGACSGQERQTRRGLVPVRAARPAQSRSRPRTILPRGCAMTTAPWPPKTRCTAVPVTPAGTTTVTRSKAGAASAFAGSGARWDACKTQGSDGRGPGPAIASMTWTGRTRPTDRTYLVPIGAVNGSRPGEELPRWRSGRSRRDGKAPRRWDALGPSAPPRVAGQPSTWSPGSRPCPRARSGTQCSVSSIEERSGPCVDARGAPLLDETIRDASWGRCVTVQDPDGKVWILAGRPGDRRRTRHRRARGWPGSLPKVSLGCIRSDLGRG